MTAKEKKILSAWLNELERLATTIDFEAECASQAYGYDIRELIAKLQKELDIK